MKKPGYQKRFYRNWIKSQNLFRREIIIDETDLLISADKEFDSKEVKDLIISLRQDILSYSQKHKEFLGSLQPLAQDQFAPGIAREMLEAALLAGVGPMAAVAGAMAQNVANKLIKFCDNVIIENGGDIFLKTDVKRVMAVYAGDSKLSGKIKIEILPQISPCGICCSSATVGHSLSFGKADAVVVVSKSAALADAVATAACNRIKKKEDLKSSLEFARNIQGIEGVLIIMDDLMSIWGNLKLV